MSPSRLRVNSTLPAPTNAILGIWFLTNRGWRANVESQTRSAPFATLCPPRSAPLKKIPLIAAVIAGALLATAAVAGARPAASKPVDITVWHAQTD